MLQTESRKRRKHISYSRVNAVACLFLAISLNVFPAYAAGSDLGLNRCLKEAQTHYKDGRFSEAIDLWNEALSIDPANEEARKGVKDAEEKIKKIKNFFGWDVSGESSVRKSPGRLSIENCIDIAEENTLALQLAEKQITLGKIKVWEARRAFLPALTLSWAETKGIQSGGKIEGVEYGIEGKQPAFHSGELMYTLAQAKTNLNMAEKNYDKVKYELDYKVAEAYYALVKAVKTLEYTKTVYEDIKPLYEIARKEYDKEIIPDIEYLNAESKLNKIYYKSISTYSDFELAKLALEQKLNTEGKMDMDIVTEITPKIINPDIETCLSLAMQNRPDLKLSELALKSAEYGRKIAQSKEMPRVDLAGHYKRSSEVYRQSYGNNTPASLDPHRKWYAGLEVVWPFLGSTGTYSLYKREDPQTLSTYYGASESKGTSWKLDVFDNLKQFTESQEAEIVKVRAEEELEEARKNVVMDVKEAFYSYEKARIQLDAARSQREFSEKEVKILKVRRGMGEIELSELFESVVGLMEAAEAYFEAEKALNTSIAALNTAIGIEGYF